MNEIIKESMGKAYSNVDIVMRINKSLFNLCRERYNKIAGKVRKLQFIYGRMKELTEQGRVNKTAMTGHTIWESCWHWLIFWKFSELPRM